MTDREKYIRIFQFFAANDFDASLIYQLDGTARLAVSNGLGAREVLFEDCHDATPDLCGEILSEMAHDILRTECLLQPLVLLV
jgi:hypothetical protein